MLSGKTNCGVLVVVVVTALALFHNVRGQSPASKDCSKCDQRLCPAVNSTVCPHGITTDKCKCCYECAKGPGQLCSLDRLVEGFYHGQCGTGMACRKRKDVAEGYRDEWMCFCESQREVCGADAVTYANMCQLTAARRKASTNIPRKHFGPCKQVPVIVGGPGHMAESVGSWITMSCEASGYPIPSVRWVYTHGRIQRSLPGGDPHVAVNSRGGPEKYETTGFLQIMDLGKEHEGDYFCVAYNEMGETNSSARLLIKSGIDVKTVANTTPLHRLEPTLQAEYRPLTTETRTRVTVDYINAMPYEEFIDMFGDVIDNCALCASAVWSLRPFNDSKDLQIKMTTFIDALPRYGQAGILRGYQGIKSITKPQFEWTDTERQSLNAADEKYKQRFGFPLILDGPADTQANFQTLLTTIRGRLKTNRKSEMNRGIEMVKSLAKSRICELIDGDDEYSGDSA